MSNPRILAIIAMAALSANALAQSRVATQVPDYQFTIVKENPITSIKNQYRSSTCWSFSTISFLESEAIRLNNIKDTTAYPDFSEMFVVSHSYIDRAEKYVRLDGLLNFGPGSEADDVLHVVKDYGIVPQAAQPGLNYGTELPVHAELDAVLKAYVEAIAKNPNRKLSTAWKKGFEGILSAYLGEFPTEFEYQGKTYTPESFRDYMKINPDDYVTLTSFTHHPYYTKFVIEICDNWRYDEAWNLPLDEFMQVLYNAIDNGYTVAWGTDCSEPTFNRNGVAWWPDDSAAAKPTSGSDQERWVGKEEKKDGEAAPAELPVEKVVTAEDRQAGFDGKQTTDDHGMHIYGEAKDQNGNRFFLVKNSWGKTGKYDGIWYVSDSFVRAKSMDIMVHKDALPKDIRKKLAIK